MHEYSICIALLEQVEQIARQHEAEQVEKIILKIGPLSGVEAELLQHAWPLAAAQTVAEDAELVIEPAVVVVRCTRCNSESEVPPNRLLCLACGDFRTRLVSGDEMLLASVELLKKEQQPCASPYP
ncbi:MAG TPA: hydrogenase maturation nickel metallochaperone HypA [Gammaproteobacteria bacterium]|nr:hydrogenase maturation nickel metallochaperone HypA [Gammaproteobacteria bacterium]